MHATDAAAAGAGEASVEGDGATKSEGGLGLRGQNSVSLAALTWQEGRERGGETSGELGRRAKGIYNGRAAPPHCTMASRLRPVSWEPTARRGALSTSPPRSNTAAAPMPVARFERERGGGLVGRLAEGWTGSQASGSWAAAVSTSSGHSGVGSRNGASSGRGRASARRRTRADAHGDDAKAGALAAPHHLVQQRGGLHTHGYTHRAGRVRVERVLQGSGAQVQPTACMQQ